MYFCAARKDEHFRLQITMLNEESGLEMLHLICCCDENIWFLICIIKG